MPQPECLALTIVSVVLVVLPAAATVPRARHPSWSCAHRTAARPSRATRRRSSPSARTEITSGMRSRSATGSAGPPLCASTGPVTARLAGSCRPTSGTRLGDHVYQWVPPARPAPASNVLRLWTSRATATVVGMSRASTRSSPRRLSPGRPRPSIRANGRSHPTVDVLGITGAVHERRNAKAQGAPAGPAFRVGWAGRSYRAHALNAPLGRWSSGVNFVRERADDGRVGFTPIVAAAPPARRHRSRSSCRPHLAGLQLLRPSMGTAAATPGTPAGAAPVRLGRPYLSSGVPAHFHPYDLPFLLWWRGTASGRFLTDTDLA